MTAREVWVLEEVPAGRVPADGVAALVQRDGVPWKVMRVVGKVVDPVDEVAVEWLS